MIKEREDEDECLDLEADRTNTLVLVWSVSWMCARMRGQLAPASMGGRLSPPRSTGWC